MSDNLNPSVRRSTNAQEVFSPEENSPPMNEYLTDISGDDADADYCVMRCVMPAGAVVPMHSHADRETFYVLSGTIEGLREDHWEELGPGDVFDVRDGAKHAWRNSSQVAAMMICVTTTRMARFLQDISAADASLEDQALRFLKLVQANGYWLASPEENAAIGLDVNWGASHN